MAELVGALRRNAIKDSLGRKISDGLRDLQWTEIGSKSRPFEFLGEALNPNEEIRPNKVALSLEDLIDAPYELGSMLTEDSWDCYLDIYAENEGVGSSIAADLSAILRGKMPSISQGETSFAVIDYRDGTTAFYCDIEDVIIERQRMADRPFNKYWWTVAFTVKDYYTDDLS